MQFEFFLLYKLTALYNDIFSKYFIKYIYIYRTITSKLPFFRDGSDIEILTTVGVQLHAMVLLVF